MTIFFSLLHLLFTHLDHILLWYSLRDAYDERYLCLHSFQDGGGRGWGWHEDDRGICTPLLYGLAHVLEDGPAQVRLTRLGGIHAPHYLCTISYRLLRVEGALK